MWFFFKFAVIKFIKVQKKFSFKKKYHTNPSFPFVLTKFHVNFECPPYFLEWHKGQKNNTKKGWQQRMTNHFSYFFHLTHSYLTKFHVNLDWISCFLEWQRPKKMTQKKAKWQQRTNHFGLSLSYNNFHPESDSQQPVTIVELYRFSTGTHVLLNLMIYAHSFVLTRTRNDC